MVVERNLLEERPLKASMIGALILAVWGIVMAAVSSSGVVLLDGMFNLVSGIMSFFSIEISRLVSGKETREFPLGYFAFESLFVLVKGASILVLVAMALYSSVQALLAGGREPALGLLTIYVAVAVAGCFILYVIARRGYKQTDSEILQVEMKAWLINGIISSAIGIAFIGAMLLQDTPLGRINRYIDQILVIVLSLLFIKDPVMLMKSGLRELLLAAPQREYAKPFEDKLLPLKEQLGVKNFALEVLKTGRRIWLTIRIDPGVETVSMDELIELKAELDTLSREVYGNTQTEVILDRF
jgi:predicted Co/Zn/Cd cation transporter (cation efflux family)